MKRLIIVILLLLSISLFSEEKIVYFGSRSPEVNAVQIQKWLDKGWYVKSIATFYYYGIYVVFTTEK